MILRRTICFLIASLKRQSVNKVATQLCGKLGKTLFLLLLHVKVRGDTFYEFDANGKYMLTMSSHINRDKKSHIAPK